MFSNPYRGEVSIHIGGEQYIVWYGWSGVALLQSRIGQDFDVKIGEAISKVDLPVLAVALSIGLHHQYPEMTPEKIFTLAPPIAGVSEAISRGLRISFHGVTGEVPGQPDTNPPLRNGMRSLWSFASSWLPVGRKKRSGT